MPSSNKKKKWILACLIFAAVATVLGIILSSLDYSQIKSSLSKKKAKEKETSPSTPSGFHYIPFHVKTFAEIGKELYAPQPVSLLDDTFDWKGYDFSASRQKVRPSTYLQASHALLASYSMQNQMEYVEEEKDFHQKKGKSENEKTVILNPQSLGPSSIFGLIPNTAPQVLVVGEMIKKKKKGKITIFPKGLSVIPESFDSRNFLKGRGQKVPPVMNQGNCGCCYAFAAATVLTYRLAFLTQKNGLPVMARDEITKKEIPLFPAVVSPQFYLSRYLEVYKNRGGGCDGGDLSRLFRMVETEGIVFEKLVPFAQTAMGYLNTTGHRAKCEGTPFAQPTKKDCVEGKDCCEVPTAMQVKQMVDEKNLALHPPGYIPDVFFDQQQSYEVFDESAIKMEILWRGPVAASLRVTPEFERYTSGILTIQATDPGLAKLSPGTQYHAVSIIGWGKNYWILQNSWGPEWGDHGYCLIENKALGLFCRNEELTQRGIKDPNGPNYPARAPAVHLNPHMIHQS